MKYQPGRRLVNVLQSVFIVAGILYAEQCFGLIAVNETQYISVYRA